MSEIRPMRREEVNEVARALPLRRPLRLAHPAPRSCRRGSIASCLATRGLTPEIPSLVYVDNSGEILGFIGSHVRRMRFDGEPVRMAAAGPLIAHPKVRNRGVGAMLWRRYLTGPQELTITDGASDEMRQIFELIGGQMMHPSSISGCACSHLGLCRHCSQHERERAPPDQAVVRTALPALDRPTTRAISRFHPPPAQGTSDELLTPKLLLEHMPQITRLLRLVPDYDEQFLEWVFEEMNYNRTWGHPHRRLVRGEDGQSAGLVRVLREPQESCMVLQLAAQSRNAGAVIDNLFAHAVAGGGAAVQGRVEAHILAPVAHRGADVSLQRQILGA